MKKSENLILYTLSHFCHHCHPVRKKFYTQCCQVLKIKDPELLEVRVWFKVNLLLFYGK